MQILQMDEVKRYLLCFTGLFATFSGSGAINATITVMPSFMVTVINDSTFFNCSTSLDDVEWLFNSYLNPQQVTPIYSYGKINTLYEDRFRIENYTDSSWKEFNLIHLSVTEKDAGLYICGNPDRLNEEGMKVHLTVLDTEPTCAANWNSKRIIGPNSCGIEPEMIQLSCSVRYTGNKSPTLTIRKVGEDVSIKPPSVVCSNSGHTYTCNLTMDSDLQMDGSSYICQTNESTTKQYSCISEALRIIYATGTYSETNATVNDKENCTINSSQPCNYTWKFSDSKGVPSESYGQDIDLKRSGTYICEADCPMRDKNCTTTVKKVVVLPQSGAELNTTLIVGLPVGLFIGICLLILLIILMYKKRKGANRKKPVQETDDGIEMEPRPSSTGNTEDRHDTDDDAENRLLSSGAQNSEDPEEQSRAMEKDSGEPRTANADIELVEINGVTFEVITPDETKCESKNGIRGITLLNQQLFIATERCNKIEVYDSKSKTFMKPLSFESLLEPGTMASCRKDNCIYLIDKKYLRGKVEIFKFSPDGELLTKWSDDVAYGRLSVIENTGDLVLTRYHTDQKPMLKIFSAEGMLINTIKFTNDSIMYPWHAVKLSQGGFVVTHGRCNKDSRLHQLCKIDEDGNILKSFGGEVGSGIDSLNDPSCVIETPNESILVADMNNHRVLLLSKDLEFRKVLFAEEYRIKFPEALYFDEENNRLYVACNLETVRHGRVICLPCTIN